MSRPRRNGADALLDDPLLHGVPIVEGFKVLDPAVLYAQVGLGGMGAVYRGRHCKRCAISGALLGIATASCAISCCDCDSSSRSGDTCSEQPATVGML